MARRKLWNALMGDGLGGTKMPMRPKLDARWREKIGKQAIVSGTPTAVAEKEAIYILARAARDVCQVVSQDIVAVLLLTLAESIATPTPDGRPKGASSLNADDAKRVLAIQHQDDGSSGARGRAIEAVVLVSRPRSF